MDFFLSSPFKLCTQESSKRLPLSLHMQETDEPCPDERHYCAVSYWSGCLIFSVWYSCWWSFFFFFLSKRGTSRQLLYLQSQKVFLILLICNIWFWYILFCWWYMYNQIIIKQCTLKVSHPWIPTHILSLYGGMYSILTKES